MIYLDYNSTTPCATEVLDSMLPFFTEKFGNASSKTYTLGWSADEAAEIARKQVADLINAESSEITFTSGATESCNLAIKGIFEKYKTKGNHLITCKTEHNAVLDTYANIEKRGGRVDYVSVDENGIIDLVELESLISEETVLISVMYANNETGIIQPIQKISKIAKRNGVLFFTDATQAVGKIEVDVQKDGIDLLAMSAHKMYGPKGVGALFVRRKNPRVTLQEQMNGGGHEKGKRSGTLNIPGIVGLGKACQIAQEVMNEEQLRLSKWRKRFEEELIMQHGAFINGRDALRLSHVSNLGFRGIIAERFIQDLHHEISFSLGSACTSGNKKPSHVLKAMGLKDEESKASFRISMGRFTKEEEIESVIILFKKTIQKIKSNSY